MNRFILLSALLIAPTLAVPTYAQARLPGEGQVQVGADSKFGWPPLVNRQRGGRSGAPTVVPTVPTK